MTTVDLPDKHPDVARVLGPLRTALVPLGAQPSVMVACSGGHDSVCLLGLLACVAGRDGLRLSVGAIDHGLREASAREVEVVAQLAARLQLPFRRTRLDLEPGAGLPARARASRRRALVASANDLGADWIALGHTATDQAETMLMHLTRGAGLDGIAAMPVTDRPWVRPLLGVTRAQTRHLVSILGLSAVEDPTNEDLAHFRVRLRTRVLPVLRERNPGVDLAFAEAAVDAAEAEEALRAWAGRELDSRQGEGGCDIANWGELPRAVRTRMLLVFLAREGVDMSELRRRVVQAIDRALVGPDAAAPRRWELREGFVVRAEDGSLSVVSPTR